MTFDVRAAQFSREEHGWVSVFEVFAVCRHCHKPSLLVVRLKNFQAKDVYKAGNSRAVVEYEGSLNDNFDVTGYISLKDEGAAEPPAFVPPEIEQVFREGASCLAVQCPNAAATMFRLCVDLATEPLLPDPAAKDVIRPDHRTRRDLAPRLKWLFEHERLPRNLQDLAGAVRENGNDGAHRGTLSQEDAEDIFDFAYALLDRLYTEPGRIEDARKRRESRRPNRTAS